MTKPTSFVGDVWFALVFFNRPFQNNKSATSLEPFPFPVTLLEEIQSKMLTCSDFCTQKLDNVVVI